MPKPTARERIENLWDRATPVGPLLDAFEAEHRARVLTEAHGLITAASLARLEAINEDDRRPSDWDRHGEWCDAAAVLLAARAAADAPHTN